MGTGPQDGGQQSCSALAGTWGGCNVQERASSIWDEERLRLNLLEPGMGLIFQ